MKFKVLLLFFLLCGMAQGQEIKWMSMDEALAAQKNEAKPIFMDAYTTWCGPCKMLDKNTFSNKKLAAYVNEHYYPVKFNAEGNSKINYKEHNFGNPNFVEGSTGRNSPHEFARALEIKGYPSLVFFDKNANLIAPMPGYRTPKQLEIYLKIFADTTYKELNTEEKWQAYQEKFQNKFVE